MTDFLLFIGPYKCLAYGAAIGFIVGTLWGSWAAKHEGKQ